jgi:TusA-related sulfurtransferase
MTDIEKFVALILPPGGTTELRFFLQSGKIWSGFYDNAAALLSAAQAFGGEDEDKGIRSVGMLLNPIHRDTLKFVNNEINLWPKFAAGAKNIWQRRWMVVDVDPERDPAAGKGVGATASEKAEAWEVFNNVITFLDQQGWPRPVITDSGNGYHAFYRVNLPNQDYDFIRHALKTLAHLFDRPTAKVDKSVFDPSRIIKIAGTWARKGENTAERPHRKSRILSVPDQVVMVPGVKFIELHRFAPPGLLVPIITTDPISDERLEEFFETFEEEIEIVDTKTQGGTEYHILAACPFKGGEHFRQDQKTAIISSSTGIGFKCFSDACCDYTFYDLLELLEGRTGIEFDINDDFGNMERCGVEDAV